MKKKQPARNRARNASAKELERDAKLQLEHLDRVKPRPRKMTAEEDREDWEALAQLSYLDQYKPRTRKLTAKDIKKLDAIHYKHQRETLPAVFWDELLGHLRRGNLTTAHYLLTSPGYLGSFAPAGGPQPPATIKKDLARRKIKSRRALHKYLDDRLGEARGEVLERVLRELAGACLFGEMLALLPCAREALRQAGPNNTHARQAVSLCRQALLHLAPDAGAQSEDADLIGIRRDYNQEPF